MSNPSGDHYIRDFLRDLDQRAPQGAALLAFIAVAAVAPSQVRASDIQSLHARHPITRRVSADVVRGIVDPPGAHDPTRGQCLGSVRPTGQPADALVYDRRLGILSWVDDAGWPTYAPPDYRDTPVVILGGPEEHGPVETVYYAFAERQRASVVRRTLEHVQNQLTPEAVAGSRTQISPFDKCRTQDVDLVRQERAATELASRAIVARAAHEARISVESSRQQAADSTVDPVSAAATKAAQHTRATVVEGTRQATTDVMYDARSRVEQGVYSTVSNIERGAIGQVLSRGGPSADEDQVEGAGVEEAQEPPTIQP